MADPAPTAMPKHNCIKTKIYQLVKKYPNKLKPGKITKIFGDKKYAEIPEIKKQIKND